MHTKSIFINYTILKCFLNFKAIKLINIQETHLACLTKLEEKNDFTERANEVEGPSSFLNAAEFNRKKKFACAKLFS